VEINPSVTVRADWVQDRLGGYVRMGVDERREAVAELAEDGLSLREIAGVVGTSYETVNRDLSVTNVTPDDGIAPDDAPFRADDVTNGTPDPDDRIVGYDPPLKHEAIIRDVADAAETAAAVARVLAVFVRNPDDNSRLAEVDRASYVRNPHVTLPPLGCAESAQPTPPGATTPWPLLSRGGGTRHVIRPPDFPIIRLVAYAVIVPFSESRTSPGGMPRGH
jgi:hypothetical protein